jgi:molybdopterin-guanine dinucleotide biosynthesis protein B
MVPQVIAVVGYSDSGKTTVASFLVERLTAEGYRVAAVKHCPHGLDLGGADSDTERLYRAGAVIVVAASPDRLSTIERAGGDATLKSVVSSFGAAIDLVIAEGFKGSEAPKVLVVGDGQPPPAVDNVVAVVSGVPGDWDAPAYSPGDLDALADQLRREFLERRPASPSVELFVDGVEVSLKQFPSSALAGMVRGFVSALAGAPGEGSEIKVVLRAAARHSKPSNDQATT